MKNIKKAAVVAVLTGGIAMATGGAAFAWDGSGAEGAATQSPGAVSGNTIQAPIEVPVGVCSNTIDIVGLLNPAFGQPCLGS